MAAFSASTERYGKEVPMRRSRSKRVRPVEAKKDRPLLGKADDNCDLLDWGASFLSLSFIQCTYLLPPNSFLSECFQLDEQVIGAFQMVFGPQTLTVME